MNPIVNTKILLTILVFLVILGCTPSHVGPTVQFETNKGKVIVDVETAVTLEERSIGLMHRAQLGEDAGMLFIFEDEAPRTFWMKNTLIPLDMIFIDSNWNIVDIIENVPPCKKDPCQTYPSLGSAKYVLEVNSGYTKKNHIDLGTNILPAEFD